MIPYSQFVLYASAVTAIFVVSSVLGILYILLSKKRQKDTLNMVQSAFDSIPTICYVKDTQFRFVMVNTAFEAATKLHRSQIVGRRNSDILSPREAEISDQFEREVLESGKTSITQYHFKDFPSGPLHAEVLLTPYTLGNKLQGLIGIAQDISENRSQEDALRYFATHDKLTNLPDRQSFKKNLQQLIEKSYVELSKQYAVFDISLDGMGVFNDENGREIGDDLLYTIASRIRKFATAETLVCRLSGNDFGLIAQVINPSQARQIANQLCSTVSEPLIISNREFNVTASIGIAIFPEAGKSASDLIYSARAALRSLTTLEHRGAVVFYGDDIDDRVTGKQYRSIRIKEALRNNEFALVYQRIMNLKNMQTIGFEAFLRWDDNQSQRLLRPDNFISSAEASGIKDLIGNWAIERALQEKRDHQETFGKDTKLFINVFPSQIEKITFCDWVIDCIAEYDIPYDTVVLDIPESVFGSAPSYLHSRLEPLVREGVQIFIDDFGTAKSSPLVLQRLPIHGIRIHNSLIGGIASDPQKQRDVDTLINMARGFDQRKYILAEAVPSKDDFEYVKTLDIDYAQGNHFGKPFPVQILGLNEKGGPAKVHPLFGTKKEEKN